VFNTPQYWLTKYLYHSFSWKIVYIYMHSALTGVQVLVTRTPEHAHWLAHFCWGLLIVTAGKGKAIEISYSDARWLVTFFLGLILWQQGTFFCLTIIQKRKNIKTLGNLINNRGLRPPRTNQNASCFDALSITYKMSKFIFLSQVLEYRIKWIVIIFYSGRRRY
jgi:hypothetical protein